MSDMDIVITYDGIEALKGEVRKLAKEVVATTAFSVEANAKAVVPVRTGRLRNSITSKEEGDLTWTIAPHTDYAIFVEYGTRFMRERSYMRPAAEKVRAPFKAAMDKMLNRAVEDVGQ